MLSANERRRAEKPGRRATRAAAPPQVRAQAGEDAGPAPEPAGVLAQDAVAHVMRRVLDPPMGPDRAPEALGGEPDLADVVGDLAAGPPQAGAGVLAPGQAGDPGGAGHPLPPTPRAPT